MVSSCGMQRSAEGASWRKRFSAWLSNRLAALGDLKLGPVKEKLLEGLTSERGVHDVAEIGIGSGPNLKYYGAHVDSVVGVDNNPAVMQYARAAAVGAGMPPDRLQLLVGTAEQLPLEDESMDAVVGTHLLCSVTSPEQAVAEVRRVLRPGGRYIFIEHVLAPPSRPHLATYQRWAARLVRVLADGCHVDRRSLETIQEAGFTAVAAEEFRMGAPGPISFWDPHVCGTAVK